MSTRPIEGDPWQPSASEARRYARMADAYERAAHRLNVPVTAPPSGPGVVQVLNDTEDNIPRFGVLGIDSTPVVDPAEAEDRFCSRALLRGVAPVFPDHDGRFAIAMHPGQVGQLLYCVIAGLSICKVTVAEGEEWYEFADVLDGDLARLTALPAGAAQLLWREDGPGEKWAVVRLGAPCGSVIEDCVFTGGLDGGTFGQATVRGGEYTITAVAPSFFTEDQTSIAPGSLGAVRWHRWLRQWIAIAASCAG